MKTTQHYEVLKYRIQHRGLREFTYLIPVVKLHNLEGMAQKIDAKEVLQAARFGETEELRRLVAAKADVNTVDKWGGSTPLHYACANGQLECIKVLVSAGAKHLPNKSGNLPLHWCVQNKKVACVKWILKHFTDLDVLQKNSAGVSALTFAFNTGDNVLASAVIEHPSAAKLDPKLEKVGNRPAKAAKVAKAAKTKITATVTHEILLGGKTGPAIRCREMAIDREVKDIFGPRMEGQMDVTGHALWPAEVILAQWVAARASDIKGKLVCELGAGCGLAGIAAVKVAGAASICLTDVHPITLANLRANLKQNGLMQPKDGDSPNEVIDVDWADPKTWADRKFDFVIGADLVYGADAPVILLQTLQHILRIGGTFLYVCAEKRLGTEEFASLSESYGLKLKTRKLSPKSLRVNPLVGKSQAECDVMFDGLSPASGCKFTLFEFGRVCAPTQVPPLPCATEVAAAAHESASATTPKPSGAAAATVDEAGSQPPMPQTNA